MDHILVVDDDEEVRITLKSALEKCFEVSLAAGALQAVAICREQPIRLVISDLRMPTVDGRLLIETLRETRPEIPIIIISAHLASLGPEEKTLRRMVDHVLHKPFRMELLVSLATYFLSLRGSESPALHPGGPRHPNGLTSGGRRSLIDNLRLRDRH